MGTDLRDIKVQSQNTFAEVSETADDTLYFVEAIVVVKSYRSGTDWYRIYSDGWCEQGGQTNSVAPGTTVPVVLHKGLDTSDFSLMITSIGSYSADTSSCCMVTAKTANTFTLVNGCSTNQAFMWEAKGYLNE